MAQQRQQYEPLARQAAQAAGIDPAVFLALVTVESGWDPEAVSPAGTIGIAQIMPRWHPAVNPWDPAASLAYAARLLRSYLERFGSVELALAAYNAGPGAVEQYEGIPPFAETQAYVRRVLALAHQMPATGTLMAAPPASRATGWIVAGLLVAAVFILGR